ncbi:hypothetical protein H5410_014305 [Solanum commersonii]|uniref:Gag-pol polyprotein n=1 Tax=Solanum commersonii TaxID=4109 RepID=A0A9J5ZQJ9_SOLCO|nr:hypothetical protein H5410_014305 [Solanum commersonii]
MPLRIVVRGLPARHNVEEQELPNAPEVQPQGEVTNVEFRDAIRMLSQAVTNQVGQQRGARQEEADTSRIREFLRMNPLSFTGSSTIEDPENFIEELKKWKGGRAEDAPPASWTWFEEDSLSVHEYGLKFTQLSRYAPDLVKDMISRMSLFVPGLGHLSRKKGNNAYWENGHFEVDGLCAAGRGRET